jgi:pSer/pThr/pTyr-binding forkhead associated (FHA) protein
VDAPQVSGRHLRISTLQGALHVEDLGSSNGLYVDGQRVERASVAPNTLIGMGTHVLAVAQLLGLAQAKRLAAERGLPEVMAQRAGGPAETRRVGPDMLTLGRDAGCDIRIDDAAVSGRHARVFRSAGRLILEDLGVAKRLVRPTGGSGQLGRASAAQFCVRRTACGLGRGYFSSCEPSRSEARTPAPVSRFVEPRSVSVTGKLGPRATS